MEQPSRPDIIVYTSGPRCIDCTIIKQWLTERGYGFTERNIREDPAALADLEAMGFSGAPVTVIGQTIIDGLELKQLQAALEHTF